MLLEPGQLPWRRLYAQQLARLGDAGRARVVYEQLIEQDPTDADAHLALGNLLIERGESERAAAALATAWHLGRDDAGLARTLGDLHAQRDQPGAAVPWYDRALAATEGEPDAELLLRRARLLWRTGRVEEARQAVQALVGDGNGDAEEQTAAEAHRLLGRIALETDRPEAAAEHWRRAVEAGLGDPQLLGFLGSHHFNAGRYEEAADWLSRRLEAGRASRELMRYLVVALLRDGQPDRAGRRLRDYLTRYPLDEKAQQLIRRWRRVRAEAEPSNAESAASSSNVEQ
jgi:tetratricopeptide (TPR) repeat protein